jgi:hypothetical protein
MVFVLTEALVLKHKKSEGFHFSQKHGNIDLDIDLGHAPYTGANPLHPGIIWQYLSIFFNCSLTFREHSK